MPTGPVPWCSRGGREGEGRQGRQGVLAALARTDAVGHADLLTMGASNHPEAFLESIFLKMEGRKVYRYALGMVAAAMSEVLAKAGVTVPQVKKFLIHHKFLNAVAKR